MAKHPTSEQFWQYSLQLYPSIQQPLLMLQNELGANVNLLLLLLYAEQQQWHWSATQINQLQHAVALVNQQCTGPIRHLRQQLSHHPLLKNALLHAELEAEKLEQQALLAVCPEPTEKNNDDLLTCYLQQLASHPDNWQPLLFDLRQSLVN